MGGLREGTPQDAGLDPARIKRLRERAAQWVADGTHQNVVLMVARNDVVCLKEAWGSRTPSESFEAATTDMVFWAASNSKPVTATAIMLLVEEGSLSLNRHVRDFIPELSGEGSDAISVRHLLTHTSGFVYDDAQEYINAQLEEGLAVDCSDTEHETAKLYLQAGYTIPVQSTPGAQMSYCNINYALLAEVVRRVSGQSFWDFAQSRIFEPLGMTDSSFRFQERLENRMARLNHNYPPDVGMEIDDAWERVMWDDPNGAWGLLTTVDDYAKFVYMLLNGGVHNGKQFLHPRTVAEMTSNQIPGIGTSWFGTWHPEASWGLGLRVLSDDRWVVFDGSLTPKGVFMHGGAAGTNWWADPSHNLFGIYFSVCTDIDYERRELRMNFDVLQDMVSAAITYD